MRKNLAMFLLFVMMNPVVIYSADNESVPDNSVQQVEQQAEDTSETNQSGGTGKDGNVQSGISVDGMNNDGQEAVDGMMNILDSTGNPLTSKKTAETIAKISPIFSDIISIILVVAIACFTLFTVIEFVILINPLWRPYFLGGSGGSGTGDIGDGGTQGKGSMLKAMIGEDLKAVLGGGAGSGEIGGTGGSNKKKGMSALITDFLILKLKTIIAILIFSILVFTPFGRSLIMLILTLIMNALISLIGWVM